MRWLITGAQGFIGRYTTARILASRPNAWVVGTGRSARLEHFSHHVTGLSAPVPAPIPAALLADVDRRFQYCPVHLQDVGGMSRLLQSLQPEIILHLASGLRGESKNDLLATNVSGIESLFASIALSGYKPVKVVIASSGGVYGELAPGRLASSEFDDCTPADDYSISKLLAEKSARHAAILEGIPLAVARIFNAVGRGQSERHIAGKIAAQLMSVAYGLNSYISLGFLNSTRDFIDVRDVARALVFLGEEGEGTFNVCTGYEIRIADLVTEFLATSRINAKLHSEPWSTGVMRSCGDLTRLRQLGFQLEYSLKDSITGILDYYTRLWSDL